LVSFQAFADASAFLSFSHWRRNASHAWRISRLRLIVFSAAIVSSLFTNSGVKIVNVRKALFGFVTCMISLSISV